MALCFNMSCFELIENENIFCKCGQGRVTEGETAAFCCFGLSVVYTWDPFENQTHKIKFPDHQFHM